jgi:hypothetical protein
MWWYFGGIAAAISGFDCIGKALRLGQRSAQVRATTRFGDEDKVGSERPMPVRQW